MHQIFNTPAHPKDWSRVNAYALATGLRGLTYEDRRYVNGWRSAIGASTTTTTSYSDGYPPAYTIAHHDDGQVLLFGGLRNIQQASQRMNECSFVPIALGWGDVMHFAVKVYQQIIDDVLTAVAAGSNRTRFVVAGHSIGGVVAMIVARRLNREYGAGTVKYAMSFGSPRAFDKQFATTMPCQAFAVAANKDHLAMWPLYSTFQTNLRGAYDYASAYWCGTEVWLTKGEWREEKGWFDETWTSSIGLGLRYTLENSNQTAIHSIENYVLHCARHLPTGQDGDYRDNLRRLNRAMGFNVDPIDFSTPVTPPSTATVTAPTLPTVAQVQQVPTAPIDPVTPTTPTYDNSLVGQTQRAAATAVVSSSPDPTATVDYARSDETLIIDLVRLILRVRARDARLRDPRKRSTVGSPKTLLRFGKNVLQRIVDRDAKVGNPVTGRNLSTQAYLIPPSDGILTQAFQQYQTAINDRLAGPSNPRDPIIDRTQVELEAAEEYLNVEFGPRLPARLRTEFPAAT